MTGYNFKPKNSKTPASMHKKKTTDSTPKSNPLAGMRYVRKPVFIAAALIILVFVLAGPKITGNLLLSSEDKALTNNPDFPDLPAFEANKQFYLCQNQLNEESGILSQYQLELNAKSTTMESCLQDKSTISSQYSSCSSDLSSCWTSFSACNSSKESFSAEIEICNDDLIIIKQDMSELELESYSIKNNYADSYCCIKRAVDANPDIKYYRFENNKVICTTDSDYEEFNWDGC